MYVCMYACMYVCMYRGEREGEGEREREIDAIAMMKRICDAMVDLSTCVASPCHPKELDRIRPFSLKNQTETQALCGKFLLRYHNTEGF